MLGVTFPAVFTRSSGGISEVNVICDVYSDSFGLQYWLYAEDSAGGKKATSWKSYMDPPDVLSDKPLARLRPGPRPRQERAAVNSRLVL